ncbi:MAG: hypothetical protein HW382_1022 [Deltaproteobacteria bacterium]|nr:hypothetical protein [Deltaproteobacteria bacterium]
MEKKELSLEEQRLKVRRKLLKLAVYGIPAISTILAAGKANADGVDEYYDEFEADDDDDGGDDDHRAGTGIKKNRKKPNGPKKYKKGLS